MWRSRPNYCSQRRSLSKPLGPNTVRVNLPAAIGKIWFLGLFMAGLSNVGKSLPYAAFFRWGGSLTVRLVGAVIILAGIPAIVCVLTRHARSAWAAVLILAAAILIAPWADMCLDWYRVGQVFMRSLDSLVWEPLVLGVVMLVPVLLMRRFVPAFRCHESVP